MQASKSSDSVTANRIVRNLYSGSLYRLSVWFFFSFVLLFPLLFQNFAGPLVSITVGIVILLVVYESPELLSRVLANNTVLAERKGTTLYLYLEQDHEIDLRTVREITVESGLIPINRLTIHVAHSGGQTETIKTRYQLSKLVFFLRDLKWNKATPR